MTSFNHYALGAVADWLHRVVAGLAPLAPGYREVRFAPRPGGGLTRAAAQHRSPYGMVGISWELVDRDFVVETELPTGVLDLNGHRPGTSRPRPPPPHRADRRRRHTIERSGHSEARARTRSAMTRRAAAESKAMKSNSCGTPGWRWNSTVTPAWPRRRA